MCTYGQVVDRYQWEKISKIFKLLDYDNSSGRALMQLILQVTPLNAVELKV